MNILIASQYGPEFAGATGTVLRGLVDALALQGHRVVVASHTAPAGARSSSQDCEIASVNLGSRSGRLAGLLGLDIPVCFLKSPATIARLVKQIKREKPDFVLAVYPIEDIVFSALVACRLTATPLVTWFHDLYFGAATGWRKRFASVLEPWITRSADVNLSISPAVRDWYRAQRGGNWDVLPHPIGAGEFASLRAPAPRAKRTVFFCGAVYGNCESNLAQLVSAVAQSPGVNLEIYTANGNAARRIVDIYATGDARFRISVATNRTRREVLDRMRSADVLYLPLTFDGAIPADELNTMFPTKSVEYLLSGKTLLVHVPRSTYVYERMRTQPGVVLCTDPDAAALSHALRKSFEVAGRCQLHHGRTGLDQYAPAAVAESLCAAASRVLQGGRACA
ncbi:MAG TPA: glycosyltransferase [Terracidiphilus sp.]|nr:glycosyltransferase [Terracidiphilus sp.]